MLAASQPPRVGLTRERLTARAGALATFTRQRDLGHDAELSAQEIVRRCERRIGGLVRAGQEAGEIRSPRSGGGPRSPYDRGGCTVNVHLSPNESQISPAEFLESRKERRDSYAMTDDVTAERSEEAKARMHATSHRAPYETRLSRFRRPRRRVWLLLARGGGGLRGLIVARRCAGRARSRCSTRAMGRLNGRERRR